nr:GNAT family N-acetyltransferase [uncultured Rhodoferax sp.]
MTTAVTIRLATEQDIPAVARLFDAYRQFYEQVPDLALATTFIGERMARKESHILLAVDGQGEAMGFCQLYPSYCSVIAQPIFTLYDLYVAPGARKLGVGKGLLQAAEELGRSHGVARLDLTTARTNNNAQSIYRAMGWALDEVFLAFNKKVL